MLKLYAFLLLFTTLAMAQPPKLELTPRGFEPIEVSIPATQNEKLIEVTKAWALEYNNRGLKEDRGYDASDVTENSITISAFKKNAFYYRERGEAFEHRIRYSMKITFSQNRYTLAFTVNDIYGDSNSLLEYKLPDYFTSEGKLKEGYTGLDTSLEETVNNIVKSHYNFILNFR